jgi:hypothetical protein
MECASLSALQIHKHNRSRITAHSTPPIEHIIIYPRGTELSLSASLVFPMTVVVGKVNSKRSNLNGCKNKTK